MNSVERRLAKLDALEAAGVDNWEFYDVALEEWRKENELAEQTDDIVQSIIEELSYGYREPEGRGAGIAFNEDRIATVKSIVLGALWTVGSDL